MRIASFCLLMVIAFTTPWWLFLLAAFGYALYFEAYEIIVLGALLDAFYGSGTFALFYTLAIAAIFLIVEFVKPALWFYKEPA